MTATTASRDEFLRPADVHAEYGISPSTLESWRRRGNGGPRWQYLGPRRIVYRRSAIEAFIVAEGERGRPA